MQKNTLISWSTGKDSAWALYQLSRNNDHDIKGIFCTINKKFKRTAMHAVRVELLKLQALQLNLPLQIIEIPYPCTNEQYQSIMREFVSDMQKQNIDYFAFGDLFLEDIRQYRIDNLRGTGISAIFPIWNIPTDKLAVDIIDAGLKAVVTCVDPKQLDAKFVGREFNHDFLSDLPRSVDHCGENGEFHTFVYYSPNFSSLIPIVVSEKIERDGFNFADVQLK